MDFCELVKKTRSCRRFNNQFKIPEETLVELIELARITPSAANLQPLKYIASCSPEWNKKIFDTLAWAGYLKDWPGPAQEERPAGYIIILTDTSIREKAGSDTGIAAQTILLGAVSKGLGGCMFGSINRNELLKCLELPENLIISLIIALGKPIETVVLEDAAPGGSIEYYRTPDRIHHVPKRTVNELLIKIYS